MWDLVIFDLDGTLVNSIKDLGMSVNHVLAGRGFPCHEIDEYYAMVGHGIRNLVRQALPEALRNDDSLLDACLAEFVEYYSANIDVYTRPYEGMVELLQELSARGTALAVASNKFQSGTEALVAEFFAGIPFAAVFGNSPGAPLKPDPAIVRSAAAAAGIDLSAEGGVRRIAMVGDSGTDIQTAANAGITSIAVTWGFRPRSALLHADHVVDSVAELSEILLGR